jgi:hypothetical protein
MKEADEEFRYDEEFSDGDIDSNDELDEIQIANFYPPPFDKNRKFLHCHEYTGIIVESEKECQDLRSP